MEVGDWKPGRVYARNSPRLGKPNLSGRAALDWTVPSVSPAYEGVTMTPGTVQRVAGTDNARKVPRLMCGYSGPRSPCCYVARFAQTSVTD